MRRTVAAFLVLLLASVMLIGCDVVKTTLITHVSGQGTIDINPDKGNAYAIWDSVVLTATPESGWVFDHWEYHGIHATNNPVRISMLTSETVTAVFVAGFGAGE